MTTTAKTGTKRGFQISCPSCGERNVMVSVTDLDSFCCSDTDCGWEATSAEVRRLIGEWMQLLEWIETAPTYYPSSDD